MRAATITLTAAALVCATGAQCQFLRTADNRTDVPPGTNPLEQYDAPRFVAYLNQQAGHLQSIRYDKISLRASEAGSDMPRLSEGELVCSRPRNFRLTAGHRVTIGAEVDLGSNANEFWMYTKRPEPTFLYCSHDDFARGKGSLPIPFDPDWVLQALGMNTFDPNAAYTADVNQADRTYVLNWDAKTPQGEPIRKTIVFAGDKATGGKPQVLRHVIADANGNPIATADIKEVQAVPAAGAPGQTVQVPTRVVLEWPQQKFKMDLTLDRVRANEAMTGQETAYFFERPTISGVTPVNLATAQFRPSSTRGSTPGDGYRARSFGGR